MPMREKRDVSVDRARTGYHAIHATSHLFRFFATRASIPEDEPTRGTLMNLFERQAFVLPVIPFDQVGLANRLLAEARELAGLPGSLHRAAENELERFFCQRRSHPLCK